MDTELKKLLANREFRVLELLLREEDSASFFTLELLGKESDFIINDKGVLMLFKNFATLDKFVKKLCPHCNIRKDEYEFTKDPIFIVDAITYLKDMNEVNNSWLLDVVNFLICCVHSTNEKFPKHFKRRLYKLADHLTFSRQYDDFFKEEKEVRESYVQALYFCIGVLVGNSKII